MKRILACDDNPIVLEKIKEGMRGVSVEITLLATLASLLQHAGTGIRFDVMALDGYLRNETTIPFFENLAAGKYPHLKDTHFFLITSDNLMRELQMKCLCRTVRIFQEYEGYDSEELEKWLKENPEAMENLNILIPESIPVKKVLQAWETSADDWMFERFCFYTTVRTSSNQRSPASSLLLLCSRLSLRFNEK